MKITHEIMIDSSSMTYEQISDSCLEALGHSENFKLKAELPTDTLHGSVSIIHNDLPLPHVVIVEVYETDESPTDLRQSTLARPAVMPTEQDLINKLETLT